MTIGRLGNKELLSAYKKQYADLKAEISTLFVDKHLSDIDAIKASYYADEQRLWMINHGMAQLERDIFVLEIEIECEDRAFAKMVEYNAVDQHPEIEF
jgi:hypothetical protein